MKLKLGKIVEMELRIPEGLGIECTAEVHEIGPKNRILLNPVGILSLMDPPKDVKPLKIQTISVDVDLIDMSVCYNPYKEYAPGLHHYELGVWYPNGDFCSLKFSMMMPNKTKKRKYALEKAIRKYLHNYTGPIIIE